MDIINLSTADSIDSLRDIISADILKLLQKEHPELYSKYIEPGFETCIEDIKFHMTYLSNAIRVNNANLFSDYITWVRVRYDNLQLPANLIRPLLTCVQKVFSEKIEAEKFNLIKNYIDAAFVHLEKEITFVVPFINMDAALGVTAFQYMSSLLRGERKEAADLIMHQINNGISVKDIYINIFQVTQYEIGSLWLHNKISVAQEHYCTAVTQTIMAQLYPYIFTGSKNGKKMVSTCISGDLHELGIRMVSDFFEMDGWDTYYLGANTPIDGVIDMLVKTKADLLAVSATISMHLGKTADLIKAVKANEKTSNTKVLVGGFPFNKYDNLWKTVGADGYSPNAQDAIKQANNLCR